MAGNISGSYLERVRTIVAGAKAAKHAYSSRNNKRDTILTARTKVAEKLRENKAYFLDPANVQKPDSVYKEQADGCYSASMKYGNRYLAGAFDGNTYVTDIPKEDLPALLEMFASDAESGLFDTQINEIMQANIEHRSKAKR
jgi:hypothetical protein